MRKRKYFYQLLATSLLLLIIPSVLFFALFNKSYRDISKFNADYYRDITRLFSGTVVNEITQMKEHAIAFSVDSRTGDHDGEIFHEGTNKMAENPYYYWEAAMELQEYSNKVGYDEIGLYYYDAGFILHDGIKYTVDRFIKLRLNVDPASATFEKVSNFFGEEKYHRSDVIFAPVYDVNGEYESMLVGICVGMGKANERSLMFYQLRQKDLEFIAHSVQARSWEKYMVLDRASGEYLFGFGESKESQSYDIEELSKYAVADEQSGRQNFFVVENSRFNLAFAVDVSENEEQNIVYTMYSNVKLLLIYIPILLIVMCCATVYYNYQPVQRLVSTMRGEDSHKGKGTDEFHAILSIWENQNRQLSEQQMIILDLLMNRLIYGLPISEEHVGKLDICDGKSNYCVFLIDGYVLDTEEVGTVAHEVNDVFQAVLLMSDIPDEKNTVIVAFMEQDKSAEISVWLSKWCKEHIAHAYSFFTGNTVYDINDIDKSLKWCKEQKKQHLMESRRAMSGETSRDSAEQQRVILKFLDENIQNPDLSQTMIADRFHISVYSLSRMCKNIFGVSFSEYVTGKRMELVKELLHTDMSISEIASKVGISDPNYLSRLFKRSYGVSPSEFRKTIQS